MYYYDANGVSLGGVLVRPIAGPIPGQAMCSVPTIGGTSRSRVEHFNFRGLLSFDLAQSEAVSGIERRHGVDIHVSSVSVIIEGLNILNMFIADRIVARLAAEHDPRNDEPNIITTGSYFDNLRVAGHAVEVKTAHNVFYELPTYAACRAAWKGGSLRTKLAACLMGSTLPPHPESEEPQHIVDIRKGFKEQIRSPDLKSPLFCSFVKEIDGISSREIKNYGPIIVVPQFGTIYLGEVIINAGHRCVNMFRIEMGSPDGGTIVGGCNEAGGGCGEAHWRPTQTQKTIRRKSDNSTRELPKPKPFPGPGQAPAQLPEIAARYADVQFLREKNDRPSEALPKSTILKAGTWYYLEVAVRQKPIGLRSRKEEPIRTVKQDKPIQILVTADSSDFDFESQVGRITLPPVGDSTKNVTFRIRAHPLAALTANRAHIELRFFYRFNLLEYVIVTANIGNIERKVNSRVLFKFHNEICREYLDFDEFIPRSMNIHITRENEVYRLKFTLNGAGGDSIVLLAQSKLTSTVLEDLLVQMRKMLGDLVLRETLLQSAANSWQARETIQGLAELGHKMWLGFFRNEPGSALDAIGAALRDRPLDSDSMIQVSMPGVHEGFLFPWAFLYDQPLPKSHEMPEIHGFWGYRYAIEQHITGASHADTPKEIDDCLKIAFMLWEGFPNAEEQKKLMIDLRTAAAGKLAISDPPITTREKFYESLEQLDDSVLYFYTHGHYRRPQSASNQFDLAALIERRLAQLSPESADYMSLRRLLERLGEEESEIVDSYIELSHGRLYYYELLELVDELSSEPFVFLNMCESAEMVPLQTENFVSLFLKLGARSVLGTECTMTATFAHPFSVIFLTEVLRGEQMADALRSARRHFLEKKNPLGLAYTLYGSGTMRFLPPRLLNQT